MINTDQEINLLYGLVLLFFLRELEAGLPMLPHHLGSSTPVIKRYRKLKKGLVGVDPEVNLIRIYHNFVMKKHYDKSPIILSENESHGNNVKLLIFI